MADSTVTAESILDGLAALKIMFGVDFMLAVLRLLPDDDLEMTRQYLQVNPNYIPGFLRR